ncbi:MAG: S1C family serine protease [Anaerolineae bacterium]
MVHCHQSAVPLTGEVIEAFAGQPISAREPGAVFLEFMSIVYRSSETSAAFSQLMQLARLAGRQERRAQQSRAYRAATVILVAGILAITLIFGGFFAAPYRTEQAAINDVYQRMSPAVADIRVESAGVAGSGVVFDRDGHILTSYHVVEKAQRDQDIIVQLPGLGQARAELIGYDKATDLAVLKVDAPTAQLTAASFSQVNEVRIGDLAIAIGSPYGLSNSLTVGHISAVERRLSIGDRNTVAIEGVIQADAAVNPGNSGGPLFNASGQVVGINTRIESPSGGSVGIGFAIPSSIAQQVARDIIDQGYAERSSVSGR